MLVLISMDQFNPITRNIVFLSPYVFSWSFELFSIKVLRSYLEARPYINGFVFSILLSSW